MRKDIHRADSRGFANHGWLKSHHTFSFANYYNPARMGFGLLRVINDDVVAPGRGFGTHPHDNMEIISVPLKGSLYHKDNQGNEAIIRHGEVQLMSAGSGVTHSEYNHSQEEAVNFLQIWVMPKKLNIEPRYDQREFPAADRKNRIQYIVSPIGTDHTGVEINQDAYFALSDLDAGQRLTYQLQKAGNGIYLFVLEGEVEAAGDTLHKRDAITLEAAQELDIRASADSQVLIMEVPMS